MCLDQVGFKTFLPEGCILWRKNTSVMTLCVWRQDFKDAGWHKIVGKISNPKNRAFQNPKPTHTHTYIPTNKTTFMSCHVAPADLWASCWTTNKGPAPSSSQISSTSAGKSYRRLPENQWSFQAPGGHVEEVPWDNSPYTATEVWTSLEKSMWIKGLLQLQHWIVFHAAHNT